MIEASVEYLAIGANRHPSAADWDTSGLLAYGADRNVALWEPDCEKSRGVIDLLSGHTDVVNAVKFFPTSPSGSIILSGSVDNTIIVWKRDQVTHKFSLVQTLSSHSSSVNCIATSCYSTSTFASGAADATVIIWSLNQETTIATPKQIINITPRFFPLALALYPIPESSHDSSLLAVAGTKNKIQLYILDPEQSSDYNLQVTLTNHEGWIRSLDITQEKINGSKMDVILSSASQDKYIRLWRIHRETSDLGREVTSNFTPAPLSTKAQRFRIKSQEFTVTFEALLSGHEDWIYSAKWNPSGQKLQLLSASADNSLAIWEPDSSTGVFTIVSRMGEISAEKGSTTATGSTGGFWTGLWSYSGKSVVCLGRNGSWRLWKLDSEKNRWAQGIGISGHTRTVNGISWSKKGEYLLSTSSDQTTRLHAKWIREEGNRAYWHEMARPQIHGYDLLCIDCLGYNQFVSGAEEKLLRVFKQPKAVGNLLRRLSRLSITEEVEAPDAANIPLLGLSNKRVDDAAGREEIYNDDNSGTRIKTESKEYLEDEESKLDLDHPPLENQLSKYTLWPEMEKLYGHGYEISTLSVSHDASIIATACKASSIDHAVIRLYETNTWHEIKPPLTAHSLTVTCLKFSADDLLLLSVGRDRQWFIFRRCEMGNRIIYKIEESFQQAHLRMILDVDWAAGPIRAFATAGRDKVAKIWVREDENSAKSFNCKLTIPGIYPITAVSFSPKLDKDGSIWLAIGNNIGNFEICCIDIENFSVNNLMVNFTCPSSYPYPSKSINQLEWKPTNEGYDHDTRMQLAIASEDSSIRIYTLERRE